MFDQKDLIAIANTTMPFGRYSGQVLIDLPEEYLLWFARREFPNGRLGYLMALCLEIRIHGAEGVVKPLKGKSLPADQ